MGKICTVIRDLTKQYFSKQDVIDLELNEVNNMISLWQSENNSEDYPNIKELHNFIWNKRKNSATSFIHTINNVKSLYYVLNDQIYNDKGENITNKLSDFNRNKILLKNAIINKQVTIVTYNGKKYIVNKKGNISSDLSLQDGNLDNLTEEDKQNIRTLAQETQNTLSEEQEILKNAPRNEQGRLLAPNGQVSNLTEKQYAQVRTKAFKEWFGDWENNPAEASKVIDENGEPLVVYHNARTLYTNFYNKIDKNGRLYFSPFKDKWSDRGNIVHSVFLNIKNPKKGNTEINDWYTPKNNEDGLILEANNVIEEYIIFNANQIKSATDNIGTFSRDNDDIRYNRTKTIT